MAAGDKGGGKQLPLPSRVRIASDTRIDTPGGILALSRGQEITDPILIGYLTHHGVEFD